MRFAPPAVIALLDSGRPFAFVDCYRFTLTNGDELRYTNGQRDVTYAPNNEATPSTYKAKGVIVDGVTLHSTRGLAVDEQNLEVSASPSVLVNFQPFMRAARLGFFDGAILQRDRLYFEEWGGAPVGPITLFIGRVGPIDPGGGTKASMKVKSELVLLTTKMPRNTFQTSCKNTLFDGGCTLVKNSFAVVGAVEAGSTRQVINWTDSTEGTFALGTVTFETGPNVGISRTVRVSNAGNLVFVFPLEFDPTIGDQFKAYPGCDLTIDTCDVKFSNKVNYRGFPFVPTSETSI